MTQWYAEVVKIEKVEHHPNADFLDIVTVLGDYPVIAKRYEYKVGDLAAYIPIDSIVPDIETFAFLSPIKKDAYGNDYRLPVGSIPEKYRRIKAKKIRGVYSQGLLVKKPAHLNLGDSIVEYFSLKKDVSEECEDEVLTQEEIAFRNANNLKSGNPTKAPSGWSIPYYDIDGLRKYVYCLKEDEEIVLTEKLHGQNAAYCFDGQQLWVKSRNLYKKKSDDDQWWSIAFRYNLEEKLKAYPMYIFFGEIVGNNKNFRYDAKIVNGQIQTSVFFFDIYDISSNKYFDYDQRVEILKKLELPMVPELYRGKWLGKEKMYPYAEGPSAINPSHIREGFVLLTSKERFENKLNARMQLKLVGEGFNLLK